MPYIVLRDTFGEGLETVNNLEVEIFDDLEQLNEAIVYVVEDSLESGFYGEKLSIEGVVVCEILNDINGVDINKYVKNVYDKNKEVKKSERYKLFQKLKAEFDP